jgi:hypothetical protein
MSQSLHIAPHTGVPGGLDSIMRTRRPRRYVARHWLLLVRPLLRYSRGRDAFVLVLVGGRFGPVVRPDRRLTVRRQFEGVERRRATA